MGRCQQPTGPLSRYLLRSQCPCSAGKSPATARPSYLSGWWPPRSCIWDAGSPWGKGCRPCAPGRSFGSLGGRHGRVSRGAFETSQDNIEASYRVWKRLVKVRDQGHKFAILESFLGRWESIFYIYVFCSKPGRRAGVCRLAHTSSPSIPPMACGGPGHGPSARLPGSKVIMETVLNWAKWHHLLIWKGSLRNRKIFRESLLNHCYFSVSVHLEAYWTAQMMYSSANALTPYVSQKVEESTGSIYYLLWKMGLLTSKVAAVNPSKYPTTKR